MILSDIFDSSSSSAKYKASYDSETGTHVCECRGWRNKRPNKPRGCTHIDQLAARAGRALEAERTTPKPLPPAAPYAPDIKPMLASAMKEGQSLTDFVSSPNWILEEKYDGHRLLIVVDDTLARPMHPNKVQAWSRPGHDRPSAMRTLPMLLERELAKLPAGTYDGELYIPGGTSSDVVRLDLQDRLVFVLFDVLEVRHENIMSQPLHIRHDMLEIAHMHTDNKGLVRLAPQMPVSKTTVQQIWDNGGEGAILKRVDSVYKSGWRTPDWVKVKKFDSAELTIIGFDKGKMGPQSIFKLRHDDGRETSVKILTNDLIRAVQKNPDSYLGRRVTISYLGLTTSGLFRHPCFDHFVN